LPGVQGSAEDIFNIGAQVVVQIGIGIRRGFHFASHAYGVHAGGCDDLLRDQGAEIADAAGRLAHFKPPTSLNTMISGCTPCIKDVTGYMSKV
jgi:hypothetical protein